MDVGDGVGPKTDISGTQIVLNERVDEEGYISDQNQFVLNFCNKLNSPVK